MCVIWISMSVEFVRNFVVRRRVSFEKSVINVINFFFDFFVFWLVGI